jgi:DNA primase
MTGTIPEEKISEIRQRASIVEVVSDFVSLKKGGKNYLGLCPFHSERTPSFTVNEEKGIFHCFGCGAGGNIFSFLMRASQLSFPEAVKNLALRYNISLPARELSEEEKRRRSLRTKLFDLNEAAAEYYHRVLTSRKEGEEGRRYFAERGISEETIRDHRLGFAPHAWDSLLGFFQAQGLPLNLAETVGLIVPRKEGAGTRPGYFDRFRRRVIFPIINEGGRVQAFGGRIVAEEAGNAGVPPPKYMNSPETPIYSKGHTLYGLNAAKALIREKGAAVIVEGYMDLLSLYQAGFRNAVASLGTALTSAQLNLLGRYAREAFLVFDADESGKKATERSLELFLQEGIPARVVSLPSGHDPDSFIRREKSAAFEQVLSAALPLVEYMFQKALRRNDTRTVEGKVRVVREMVPALLRLKDPLERNLYVEQIAVRLGLKESQIRDQLRGKETPGPEAGKNSPEGPRAPSHERVLLQLMLMRPATVPRVKEVVGEEPFSDLRLQKLARTLMDRCENGEEFDLQGVLCGADEDLKDLTSELLLEEESLTDAERMLEDCLRKVKLSRVRQEIREVDEEIRRRSRESKEEPLGAQGLKELLKRKQRLLLEQKKWVDGAAGQFSPAVRQ